MSSGIGPSPAHAALTNIAAATAKADFNGAIPDTPWFLGVLPNMTDPEPICTDFAVTLPRFCATQRLHLEPQTS